LLTLAKGYDGKDRSYLEAWGIGATHKESQLYTALAATQSERDATKWPQAYSDLVWRLTPSDAVPAFAARAVASSLTQAERNKATTALGFIPAPAAAKALLDVAQNGSKEIRQNQALWWLMNYKDSRWAGAGVDAELKGRGLFDPDTTTINEVTVPVPPEKSALPAVAEIAKLRGDAKRGAVAASACLMCHRVKGQGVDFGPALDGFASRQTRDVVITAIVNPSNDIAHGFEGSEITLVDGRKIHGLTLSGSNPLIVQSTGGVTQLIPIAQVKERKRLGRSLMLSADQLGLSAQQVADIVAYLR
jgi:putative heme-binding domain-containing protein